jgi:hypothetical protein
MRHRLDHHAARVLGTGVVTAAAVAVTDRERTLTARSYGYRAFTTVNFDG